MARRQRRGGQREDGVEPKKRRKQLADRAREISSSIASFRSGGLIAFSRRLIALCMFIATSALWGRLMGEVPQYADFLTHAHPEGPVPPALRGRLAPRLVVASSDLGLVCARLAADWSG